MNFKTLRTMSAGFPCIRSRLMMRLVSIFLVMWLSCLPETMGSAMKPSRTLASFPRTLSSSAFPSPSADLSRTVLTRRREFWMEWARGGAPNNLVRTIPASIRRYPTSAESLREHLSNKQIRNVVSIKTTQIKTVTKQIKEKLPPLHAPPKENTGFFYGFTANMVGKSTTDRPPGKPKPPKLKESVAMTLDEIRNMRVEMEALRKELQSLKQELGAQGDRVGGIDKAADSSEAIALLSKKELDKYYKEIGRNAEAWAAQMMREGAEDGWVEISCNKAMRKKINPNGTNKAFAKWTRDPRGVGHVNPNDDREYPCLKCTGVIDAPLDVVCLYLSQEQNMVEYNDLIENHEDLYEISPSSKVCRGQTPQILFLKPRTLVTYCKHKWLSNGSLLIVNQACRHPKKLTKNNIGVFEKSDEFDDKKQPMAFALRGANYIGRDPDDPENKTRIAILALGNPGRDVPTWAMKTSVGALANLEPFKIFHRINEGIHKKMPQLQEQLEQQAQLVSERSDGRVSRPAGMAQLGYACFWPNGGGVKEKSSSSLLPSIAQPPTTPTNGEGTEVESKQDESPPSPDSTSSQLTEELTEPIAEEVPTPVESFS